MTRAWWAGALASAVVVSSGCSRTSEDAGDGTYLGDPTYRRAELVASLVNPTNGYSALRLSHYDTGDAQDWSRLPEWNPRTEPLRASDLDADGGIATEAPLSSAAVARDVTQDPAALGADAFFRYPVQELPSASVALASRAAASSYGLWLDDARGVGGLLRAGLPDGTTSIWMTCATCHTREAANELLIGPGNDAFDLGKMIADAAFPEPADAWRTWGPGRIDVTTAEGNEPVRIADLRPVRWLTHLQQDATVKQRDRDTLAIRLETLIITSNSQSVRPPREITAALATYIWSLSPGANPPLPVSEAEESGAAIFAANCTNCHGLPGMTGYPVPLAVAGTDPQIGRSADRGTGDYRVPSLLGVSTRGMLLHDASLATPDALFDPTRTSPAFAGGRRGVGSVPGHVFGLDLDAASRASLIAYLDSL